MPNEARCERWCVRCRSRDDEEGVSEWGHFLCVGGTWLLAGKPPQRCRQAERRWEIVIDDYLSSDTMSSLWVKNRQDGPVTPLCCQRQRQGWVLGVQGLTPLCHSEGDYFLNKKETAKFGLSKGHLPALPNWRSIDLSTLSSFWFVTFFCLFF